MTQIRRIGKAVAETHSKPKRRLQSSPQVKADSNDEAERPTSRHKTVTKSVVYKTYEGVPLADVSCHFQTLIIFWDCFPIISLSIHRNLNYKLALQAAKDVMDKQMYTRFWNAIEYAYKDTSKE